MIAPNDAQWYYHDAYDDIGSDYLPLSIGGTEGLQFFKPNHIFCETSKILARSAQLNYLLIQCFKISIPLS